MAKYIQITREENKKLIKAIQKNKIDQFSKLLEEQLCDLNAQDEYGNPLIFHLLNSKKGKVHLKMIELFALNQANFSLSNAKGETIINKIIELENIAATKAILKYSQHSSLVNLKDSHGEYPLHIAIKTGSEDMVRLLAYEFVADLNIKHKDGNTLLEKEIIVGNNNMALLLIELGADPNIENDEGQNSLHLAVMHGRFAILKNLLNTGISTHVTDRKGKEPLDYAFEERKMDMIKAFVQSKGNIDYKDQRGNTMLLRAVGIDDNDHYDDIMVSFLIKLGANYNILNKKGESIISKVIKNDDIHSLKKILNSSLFKSTNINKNIIDREGEFWVQIAIENKNYKILKFLLKKEISLSQNLTSDNQKIKEILAEYNTKKLSELSGKATTEIKNYEYDKSFDEYEESDLESLDEKADFEYDASLDSDAEETGETLNNSRKQKFQKASNITSEKSDQYLDSKFSIASNDDAIIDLPDHSTYKHKEQNIKFDPYKDEQLSPVPLINKESIQFLDICSKLENGSTTDEESVQSPNICLKLAAESIASNSSSSLSTLFAKKNKKTNELLSYSSINEEEKLNIFPVNNVGESTVIETDYFSGNA